MTRLRMAAVLTSLLLCSVAPLPLFAQAARPVTTPDALLVVSEPAGADVYLDGQPVGTSPISLPDIVAGDHRVRVVKDGYLEHSRVVKTRAGKPTTLQLRLTPRPAAAVSGQAASLKILVVEGEDAVNIIQQKSAVAPVVEVRDKNDQPVAGVLVRFAIRGGRATFNGARTLSVTTNAAGRAAVSGLTPTSSGAVQISASTAFQGQTAVATIAQTNVLTSAQAAAATSAGGGGATSGAGGSGSSGGLSNTAIGTVTAGAGAGALVAIKALAGGVAAAGAGLTVVTSVSGSGIRDVTAFTFSPSGGTLANAAYTWDFGDGTTAAGASVTHIFSLEGQFTVTLRAVAGAEQATTSIAITIGSLTGTFLRSPVSGVGHRLEIVQQGNTLTGQWFVTLEPDSPFGTPANNSVGPLRGTVTSPRVLSLEQATDCQRTVPIGLASADLRSIGGNGFYGNPTCTGAGGDFTFIRQ